MRKSDFKSMNLQTLRRLFIILVGLKMTWFSEKMLIFRSGLVPNLIKKSWTVTTTGATRKKIRNIITSLCQETFAPWISKSQRSVGIIWKGWQFSSDDTAMQCTVRIYSVCQIIVVTYLGKYFCNLSCGDGGRWT